MINKEIYLDNKRFEDVVGKPVNYKGINIYPVLMEDYYELQKIQSSFTWSDSYDTGGRGLFLYKISERK